MQISPETGRRGGAPKIGNLKLASSMTLIRRLARRRTGATARPPRESHLRNAAVELKSRRLAIAIHLSSRPDQPAVLLRCMCGATHDASCSRPSTERARSFAHVRTPCTFPPDCLGDVLGQLSRIAARVPPAGSVASKAIFLLGSNDTRLVRPGCCKKCREQLTIDGKEEANERH